jgi:hypothetical protein
MENKKPVKKSKIRENFFVRMFLDNNDINEKSIVGFGAFIMMVICLGIDIITGLHGDVLPINEFIFEGFLWITLGSFGIASVDKFISKKDKGNVEEEELDFDDEYDEGDGGKDEGDLML